jgi:hypothetical protein
MWYRQSTSWYIPTNTILFYSILYLVSSEKSARFAQSGKNTVSTIHSSIMYTLLAIHSAKKNLYVHMHINILLEVIHRKCRYSATVRLGERAEAILLQALHFVHKLYYSLINFLWCFIMRAVSSNNICSFTTWINLLDLVRIYWPYPRI